MGRQGRGEGREIGSVLTRRGGREGLISEGGGVSYPRDPNGSRSIGVRVLDVSFVLLLIVVEISPFVCCSSDSRRR